MLYNNEGCRWLDFRQEPLEIPTVSLSEHLNKLTRKGLVEKYTKGYYKITHKGKERFNEEKFDLNYYNEYYNYRLLMTKVLSPDRIFDIESNGDSKTEKILKFLVLGEAGVGVRTLLNSIYLKLGFTDYDYDHYNSSVHTEIPKDWEGYDIDIHGFEFEFHYTEYLEINEDIYLLDYWDCEKDYRFHKIFQMFKEKVLVLFIFDLSRPGTFEYHIKYNSCPWWNLSKPSILLVGNKLDLIKDTTTIDRKKYKDFVEKEGLRKYIEISMNNFNGLIEEISKLIQEKIGKSFKF
ncbi:MAG: hypothetical protein ACFFCE_08120 [Promethearchaeota archaeon]